MIKTIWKFPVGADEFDLELPKDARILDVQLQGQQVQMWALVDPDTERVTRHFVMYKTGHPILQAEDLTFIGTFQVNWLVFHLFERDNQS